MKKKIKVEYSSTSEHIKYVYTYDLYSNIIEVKEYDNNILVYEEFNTYNIFNELINQIINIDNFSYESEYEYDQIGNVTKSSLHYDDEYIYYYTYFYNNQNKLVQVSNITEGSVYNIGYGTNNEINRFINYNINYYMDNISQINNNDIEVNYSYNANGIRIAKDITTNEDYITINYILDDNNNIIKEIRTDYFTDQVIEYYYDANNKVIGFVYNNNKYIYLKNLQEDITGILDFNGNLVV